MNEEQNVGIVLKDQEGHYYVLPTETLNAARVPDDAKSAIDEDLGDTTGFGIGLSFEFLGTVTPHAGGLSHFTSPIGWA